MSLTVLVWQSNKHQWQAIDYFVTAIHLQIGVKDVHYVFMVHSIVSSR